LDLILNGRNKLSPLKYTLYNLKQSPRVWFGRFTKPTVSIGCKQSQVHDTLFIKHSMGKPTLLLVYVDDMINAEDNETKKVASRKNSEHN